VEHSTQPTTASRTAAPPARRAAPRAPRCPALNTAATAAAPPSPASRRAAARRAPALQLQSPHTLARPASPRAAPAGRTARRTARAATPSVAPRRCRALQTLQRQRPRHQRAQTAGCTSGKRSAPSPLGSPAAAPLRDARASPSQWRPSHPRLQQHRWLRPEHSCMRNTETGTPTPVCSSPPEKRAW
jgi:hypothetical protein